MGQTPADRRNVPKSSYCFVRPRKHRDHIILTLRLGAKLRRIASEGQIDPCADSQGVPLWGSGVKWAHGHTHPQRTRCDCRKTAH